MKARRQTLSLLMSIVVLTLLASVSIAGPGRFAAQDQPIEAGATGQESADPCAEPTDVVEPTELAEPTVVVEPTDVVDCADDDTMDDDPSTGSDPEATDPAVERETACKEAAGIETAEDETDDGDGETKTHGLDNAIEHVFANCVKNPQAPGLLNALERLAANRERHEAHEAWKAEREAERDAAKAERDAAKADRKSGKDTGARGNGSEGGHGNPHDGDSGSPRGNGHSA